MRKLLLSQMVSVNGFFEGPGQDLSWHVVDDDFNDFAIRQLDEVDTLVFGRVTYEGMASYWTTSAAAADDPVVAGKMNELSKIVFSKTLDKAEWNNSRLAKGDLGQEIAKLKQQPGKDMVIFGSGQIVSTLTELGLIDEYRLFVAPVALGSGTPWVSEPVKLKLLRTISFKSGVVVLFYEPDR